MVCVDDGVDDGETETETEAEAVAVTAIGAVLGLLYIAPIIARAISDPGWQRRLERIAPMSAGLAVQATTDLASLPISPWTGLGVTAGWATAALVAGGLLLQWRDRSRLFRLTPAPRTVSPRGSASVPGLGRLAFSAPQRRPPCGHRPLPSGAGRRTGFSADRDVRGLHPRAPHYRRPPGQWSRHPVDYLPAYPTPGRRPEGPQRRAPSPPGERPMAAAHLRRSNATPADWHPRPP